MKVLIAVALGGALGASARYLTAGLVAHAVGAAFPWATLAVNTAGSAALGVLVEVSALAWSPSEALRAFLMVGLLGGFTTFSTFSMDVVLLAQRGRWEAAALYVGTSLFLSLGGFLVGLRATRAMVL